MGLFDPIWMYEGGNRSGDSWEKQKRKREKALAAVANMSDQAELKEVALKAPNPNVAEAAALRVEGQDALAEIAVDALSGTAARAAIRRIDDQGLLKKVAIAGSRNGSAGDAARRITDLDALIQVARISASWNAQNAAEIAIAETVYALEDEAAIDQILLRFALGDDGEQVRAAAKIRKAELQAARISGHLVLVCDTCGEIVRYSEDIDTEDPNWATSAWFHCDCGAVRGGPDRSGGYKPPTHTKLAVSEEPVEGKVVHLCPACLRLSAGSHDPCKIPKCTCDVKKAAPAVARFSPALR